MLEVSGIEVSRGRKQVLSNIHIQVHSEEIVAIVGPNGAGKSTLLGAIVGQFKCSKGKIVFCNNEITNKEPEDILREGISLVPERRQVFKDLSVKDNLLIGAYHRMKNDKKKIHEDYEKVLDDFPRLKERLHFMAGYLSGGEQQMVAIARGIMSRPRILILDEPSLGLAPLVVANLFSMLRHLSQKYNMSILVVEQNVQAAFKVSDRACVIENGMILIEGNVEDLKRDDRVKNAYLGIKVL